jgi:hypothetical protein
MAVRVITIEEAEELHKLGWGGVTAGGELAKDKLATTNVALWVEATVADEESDEEGATKTVIQQSEMKAEAAVMPQKKASLLGAGYRFGVPGEEDFTRVYGSKAAGKKAMAAANGGGNGEEEEEEEKPEPEKEPVTAVRRGRLSSAQEP